MSEAPFSLHLSQIEDPRQQVKVQHKLFDILFLVVSGVISGAEGWDEIEDFGRARLSWLKQYSGYENGIPTHDTIARVMSLINPKAFQESFIRWMQSCEEISEGAIVAIDGKTARRSFNRKNGKGPIHVVSAFCAANQQILGQAKTDEKSNEITIIPELLDLLEIAGCLVTIDAMGCQVKIAQKIIEKHADYLLAVKANQGRLYKAFQKHFSFDNLSQLESKEFNTYTTKETSRGREETRIHIVGPVFDEFTNLSLEWPGMKTIGAVITHRIVDGEVPQSMAVRYYISSKELTGKAFANAVRSHWSVENQMHWILDVAMGEDDSRIRRDTCAENLSRARHMALNLLKRDKTKKAGIKRKQKMAAMDETYLTQVIEG